ncbi:SRPBCC family protein [Kitasatospora azatica]|uniref:SRPBCC family protein n=1 Tax=Kitasatospora azatica TaxID=58347 RepID=UPI00068BBD71|nr:SRPBCC family protein [Kitasatospora azatica]
MTEEIHRTRAAISVQAPARDVYLTLTDVLGWPLLYPWITHTEVLEQQGPEDLTKFWAVRPGPEGTLRIWTSRRRLDDAALVMEFEQHGSVGAIRRLGGRWLFLEQPDGQCLVESHHWFTTDEDPAVTAAELDRHGALQMRTLKEAVEQREQAEPLVLRAEREVLLAGTTIEEVHRHLVDTLDLGETPQEEAQFVTARAAHPDGPSRAGRSVLILRDPHTVLLKHLEPPAEFALYRRSWHLDSTADGIRVTARQLAVARSEEADLSRLGEWLDRQAAADLPAAAAV